MKIAIIKYNAGNIQSVAYALNRLGIEPVVTDNHDEIASADKVIFPGVGEASSAMSYLRARKLDVLIKNLKQPFLGICLGQQLMCAHSEENDTECLGIFDVKAKKFPPLEKVPHMGWNTITDLNGEMFRNLDSGEFMYFVHSYYCELSAYTIATTDYILPFSAGLKKDNFYAFQFHPEKSGDKGAIILQNFIETI